MNSMKRQKDRTLNDELPRSVGAQYATGDQWRNNSRTNEGMEPKQKQYPAVDVTGNESKVWAWPCPSEQEHYFCDLFPLLELSCSSIYVNELLVIFLSAFNILIPALVILSSYIFILSSILQIHSKEGRSKAFSTCSSHISAVAIFYGSTAFMYLQPSSVSSMDQGKVSSVFYTIIVPMLNPLIYSLRNRDVKFALKKILDCAKHVGTEPISWSISVM